MPQMQSGVMWSKGRGELFLQRFVEAPVMKGRPNSHKLKLLAFIF
jgi:hypothetical protein